MAIKVYKDGLNWQFECSEHGERGTYGEWEHALEGAYGHAAWAHKGTKPLWEITVFDGKFEAKALVLGREL